LADTLPADTAKVCTPSRNPVTELQSAATRKATVLALAHVNAPATVAPLLSRKATVMGVATFQAVFPLPGAASDAVAPE